MTVQEIANKLVQYCREGKFEQCYTELYSPEILSAEPPGMGIPEVKGMGGIAEKGKKWNENILEFHSSEVGDPIVADSHFSLTMSVDATFKDIGRSNTSQICVYKVADGKIVEERFFY